MTQSKSICMALIFLLFANCGAQAAGESETGYNPNLFVSGEVLKELPNGKILVGGGFGAVGGVPTNRLARLFPDGGLDTTFNAGIDNGTNSLVYAIDTQVDGRVVFGGSFVSVHGVAQRALARVNADGSLDASFDPVISSGEVSSILVTSNQKIIVGGVFFAVDGTPVTRIARLNSDGSLDTSFVTSASGDVREIRELAGGKLLIAGYFNNVNGQTRRGVARLNSDGTLDTDFQDPNADNLVRGMDLQADGKIVIVGEFTTVGGSPRVGAARLNPDGTLDPSFVDIMASTPNIVDHVDVQSDGRILIAGFFGNVHGQARPRAVRLLADGNLDTAFDLQITGFKVVHIEQTSDNSIVFLGRFNTVQGLSRSSMARAGADGVVYSGYGPKADGPVYSVVPQVDGKVLIGGAFSTIRSVARNNIARTNYDGELETSFDPNTNGAVNAIALQNDGRILLGGDFTSVSGQTRNRLARLQSDGSLDATYNPNVNDSIFSIVPQADGRVVITGSFTTVNGQPRQRIARLEADGTLDPSFAPSANGTVFSASRQSDGKWIMGGAFSQIAGGVGSRVARLNADGSFDPSFTGSAPADVQSVQIRADGKVMVSGIFVNLNGVARTRVGRFNADGTLDTTFNTTLSASGSMHSLSLQADGRVVLAGQFPQISGADSAFIGRVTPTGANDPDFLSGANDSVFSTMLQDNGKVLVGGNFTGLFGAPFGSRLRVGRLMNSAAPQSLVVESNGTIRWMRSGVSPEAQEVQFDVSTNGGVSYQALGTGTPIAGGWTLAPASLPPSGQIRARARISGGRYNGSSSYVEAIKQFPESDIAVFAGNGTASVDEIFDDVGVVLFDDTLPGTTGNTRTFTIRNSGGAPLENLVLNKSGPNNAEFQLGLLGTNVLAPGATTSFTATFAPTGPDVRMATFELQSSDPDESPFQIDVAGIGLSANLYAAVQNNVSEVVQGLPTIYQMALINNGPTIVRGARAQYALPPGLSSASWSCTSIPEGLCPQATGSGNIDVTTGAIGNGELIIFNLTVTPTGPVGSTVTNTFTVTNLDGSDPVTADNQASDTDLITSELLLSDGFED